MINELIKNLNLPQNCILYLHVRLKGIDSSHTYAKQTELIIKKLEDLYNPKTILIPTFTYSFAETGLYDRVNTPSEVGRFGEEVRHLYSYKHRTMNPVFSVIDTAQYFTNYSIDETSAFGDNSLFDILNKLGHIIININLDNILFTFLHYIERRERVFYRHNKIFQGRISENGIKYTTIQFNYFVRDQNLDTKRRYSKVKDFLMRERVLYEGDSVGINFCWLRSEDLYRVISQKLKNKPDFTITD